MEVEYTEQQLKVVDIRQKHENVQCSPCTAISCCMHKTSVLNCCRIHKNKMQSENDYRAGDRDSAR